MRIGFGENAADQNVNHTNALIAFYLTVHALRKLNFYKMAGQITYFTARLLPLSFDIQIIDSNSLASFCCIIFSNTKASKCFDVAFCILPPNNIFAHMLS